MIILKYIPVDYLMFAIPVDAVVLSIQIQYSTLTLWAQVEDINKMSKARKIQGFPTGRELPDNIGKYIATVQDDMFIWHFYEMKEE